MSGIITPILLILSLTNCQFEPENIDPILKQENNATTSLFTSDADQTEVDIEEHLKKYESLKSRILKHKETLKARSDIGQTKKTELAQDYLSTMLIDSIFPYWIGTTWDFNGHTNDPLVGEVACGYFVSTTIRHLDVKINRYKVAQKASADIIKELCDVNSIEKFNAMEKLETHLETINDGEVLIIGLDYHVGFIYKKQGIPYFAHSNYENLKGVEIVPVKNCFALESSNYYVLGNLTANKQLFSNWIND